eukprot:TRINITY_DN14782_c0_g1_i2.p1 TRINITY_DN14782_c0_g1~~TRINITY_DN14782_c0_g1_i2.p1  ORF type:complete len:651 (+),score=196.40 TRINITY_DN14782_c0_g1_i2:87-2039(+)
MRPAAAAPRRAAAAAVLAFLAAEYQVQATTSDAPSAATAATSPPTRLQCSPQALDPSCLAVELVAGLCMCKQCARGTVLADSDLGLRTRCRADLACEWRGELECNLLAAKHCSWDATTTPGACRNKVMLRLSGALVLSGINQNQRGFGGLPYASFAVTKPNGAKVWLDAIQNFIVGMLAAGLAGQPANMLPSRSDIVAVHPAGDDEAVCLRLYQDPSCLPVQDQLLPGGGYGVKNYYQVSVDSRIGTRVKTILAAGEYEQGLTPLALTYQYQISDNFAAVTIAVEKELSKLYPPDTTILLSSPVACSPFGATTGMATVQASGQVCTPDARPFNAGTNSFLETSSRGDICLCSNSDPALTVANSFRCRADGVCRPLGLVPTASPTSSPTVTPPLGCNQEFTGGRTCTLDATSTAAGDGTRYCKCDPQGGVEMECVSQGEGVCPIKTTKRCACMPTVLKASHRIGSGRTDEHSYQFFMQVVSRADARRLCGGRLARVETKAEAEFIAAEMHKRGMQRVWVEGERYSKWDWRFADGSVVGLTCASCASGTCPEAGQPPCMCGGATPWCPWRPGQPTDDPYQGCLTLTQALGEVPGEELGNAKIGDEPCDDKSLRRAVVCESGYEWTPPTLSPAARHTGLALAAAAAAVASAAL